MQIDILLPIYNESKTIITFLDEIINEMENDYYKTNNIKLNKIILIEDGSNDGTSELLKNYCINKYNIDLFQFENRLGYVNALNFIISKSTSEYLVFCDSSGKYYFKDLKKMIHYSKNFDLVIGRRKVFQEQLYRELLRIFLNLFVSLVIKLRIYDIDSPFRIIKRETLNEINLYDKIERNLINLENTLIFVIKLNKLFIEVPIDYRKRSHGTSRGIPLNKVLAVVFGAFKTLIFYRKNV